MLSVSLQSHKVPKHSWPEGPRQPAETQAMCAAMDEGNLERIAFSRHTRAGNLDIYPYLAEQMRLCSGQLAYHKFACGRPWGNTSIPGPVESELKLLLRCVLDMASVDGYLISCPSRLCMLRSVAYYLDCP